MRACWLAVLLLLPLISDAYNNGVGRKPPMGWNTWCTEGRCGRDLCYQSEIVAMADAMVSSGMKDIGYEYILLDDCWAGRRDESGNLEAEFIRFPKGIKALADYIHSKGLKLGLYTDMGTETCVGGRPGSYGHYEQDAKTFASWGVDYVKADWCNTKINGTQLDPRVQYPQLSKALNMSGRPILFALCEWGVDEVWKWAFPVGQTWRSGGDHHDQWKSTSSIIEHNAGLSSYSSFFGHNDMDFLMTGGQSCVFDPLKECPGQTLTEYQTEFSLFALLNSPLVVATDLRGMSETKKAILFNTEVIAVNQDELGKQGDRVSSQGALQVWAKDIVNGAKVVVLYNSGEVAADVTVRFESVGWPIGTSAAVRSLWSHKDLGIAKDLFTGVDIPSHGVEMLRLTRTAK